MENMSMGELAAKNWNRAAELTWKTHISPDEQQEISFRLDIQNFFAGSRGPYGKCRSSDEADKSIRNVIIKSFTGWPAKWY